MGKRSLQACCRRAASQPFTMPACMALPAQWHGASSAPAKTGAHTSSIVPQTRECRCPFRMKQQRLLRLQRQRPLTTTTSTMMAWRRPGRPSRWPRQARPVAPGAKLGHQRPLAVMRVTRSQQSRGPHPKAVPSPRQQHQLLRGAPRQPALALLLAESGRGRTLLPSHTLRWMTMPPAPAAGRGLMPAAAAVTATTTGCRSAPGVQQLATWTTLPHYCWEATSATVELLRLRKQKPTM